MCRVVSVMQYYLHIDTLFSESFVCRFSEIWHIVVSEHNQFSHVQATTLHRLQYCQGMVYPATNGSAMVVGYTVNAPGEQKLVISLPCHQGLPRGDKTLNEDKNRE